MNIFKILASGNGNISETNVSAFLGYLLNPNEDHGLKDEFVKLFLLSLFPTKSKFPKKLQDRLKNQDANFNITNLKINKNIFVEVINEKQFTTNVETNINGTGEKGEIYKEFLKHHLEN